VKVGRRKEGKIYNKEFFMICGFLPDGIEVIK
jgi:hypothetical protein